MKSKLDYRPCFASCRVFNASTKDTKKSKDQRHEDRPRRSGAGHPGLRPPGAQSATGFASGGSSGPQKAALAAARKGMAQGRMMEFVNFLRPQGVFVPFVVVY